jgi:hypothetical protein
MSTLKDAAKAAPPRDTKKPVPAAKKGRDPKGCSRLTRPKG